ncbi:MAG TPA: AAA family ATPase [Methanospirillum sp.]|nr:AAA family ATPase [Methanospirillum sp.]
MTPVTVTQKTVLIDGVEIHLFDPIDNTSRWIGQEQVYNLLVSAWMKLHKNDRMMTPVLIGPPGSGKTTLARAAAKQFDRPIYMMNCTSDVRPEDLLIMPVISSKQEIRYQASSLVSAMITGSTCILDEANRMNEKSWASLAPLLDDRRYIESITAGVRIHADPEFRLVATMNDDYSTFTVPEFIESRLKPVLPVAYPSADELEKILAYNVPHAGVGLTSAIVSYLTEKKEDGSLEDYSIRDAIHIAILALKGSKHQKKGKSAEDRVGSVAHYVVKVTRDASANDWI